MEGQRMNTTTDSILKIVGLVLMAVLAQACGVKGKPMPPLQPAMIGTGAPEVKTTKVKSKNPDKEADKDLEDKK